MAAQLPLLHPSPARGPSWRRRQQQILPRPQRQPRSPLRRRKRPAPQFRNPKSPRRRQHRLLLRRAASSCRRPDRVRSIARRLRLRHRLRPLPRAPLREASSADDPSSIAVPPVDLAGLAVRAPAWLGPADLRVAVPCTPLGRPPAALPAPACVPEWVRAPASASVQASVLAPEWAVPDWRLRLRAMHRAPRAPVPVDAAASSTRRPRKAR